MISFSFLSILLDGFGYNLLITICAMSIGYPVGVIIASCMSHPYRWVRKIARGVKSLFCNVPSFVMLFYLTAILPSKWQVLGVSFHLSPIYKAIIALMIPVIGYASDAVYQRNQHGQPITLGGLKQYFILLLMASTTASAIDVKEILATANYYISTSGDAGLMLPVYLIVAAFFIGFGLLIQLIFYGYQHLKCAQFRIIKMLTGQDKKTTYEPNSSIAKSQDGHDL